MAILIDNTGEVFGRNLEDYTLTSINHGYALETLMSFSINLTKMEPEVITKAKGGCRYTWCNNRKIGVVQEKLDRCIVNWEWRKIFPNVVATALPPITSYHSPLVIEENPSSIYKQKVFKLETYWIEHADFVKTVDQAWRIEEADVMKKLNSVKSSLVDWSKNTFRRACDSMS